MGALRGGEARGPGMTGVDQDKRKSGSRSGQRGSSGHKGNVYWRGNLYDRASVRGAGAQLVPGRSARITGIEHSIWANEAQTGPMLLPWC